MDDYRANVTRFLVFFALVNFYLWMPIWVVFMQTRGMSLTQIGVLDAVSFVLMAGAEVPTGAIADRFGRKTSLIIGALLYAGAIAGVTARIWSPIFVIAYLGWTTTYTFISGADMAFLYDSLKAGGRESEHPKVAGWYLAVMQTSSGVASVLGAWLASYDMRICFWGSAAALLAAAAVATRFKEPPRGGEKTKALRYWQGLREAVRIALRRPAVRYLLLFGAMTNVFPILLTFMFVQPYAREAGAPIWSLGVIVLAIRLASAAGSIGAHRAAARFGTRVVIVGGLSVLTAGQLLLWGLASLPAIAIFLIVSFFSAVTRPVLSALINREIPSSLRATILSLESLIWTVGIALTEPVLFHLGESSNMAAAVGAAGLLTVITAVPPLLLWWRSGLPPRQLAVAEIAVEPPGEPVVETGRTPQ